MVNYTNQGCIAQTRYNTRVESNTKMKTKISYKKNEQVHKMNLSIWKARGW